MGIVQNFQSWARRQAAPVSVAVLVSLVVTSFLAWFTNGAVFSALRFSGFGRPWGIFTYPWAYLPFFDALGLLGFIFMGAWLLNVGGIVERDLGPRKYVGFLGAMILLPALLMGIAGVAMGAAVPLAGPWLFIGALTVAWATRHPNSPVQLFGILPLAAKWIAWLGVGTTLFSIGFGAPVLGLLACVHYAVAYAFASGKIPGLAYGRPAYRVQGASKEQKFREEAYYDDVIRRERERSDRERLRKLFESSINDDK